MCMCDEKRAERECEMDGATENATKTSTHNNN